jgi:hypothetical protein
MGFGHEFEKACTTSKIDGSTGHHRVISYQFSDLKFILRYETDGYVGISSKAHVKSAEVENDTLSSMIESLSLRSTDSLSHVASTTTKRG